MLSAGKAENHQSNQHEGMASEHRHQARYLPRGIRERRRRR